MIEAARRRDSRLAMCIVATCLGMMAYRLASGSRATPDEAGRTIHLYSEAAATLRRPTTATGGQDVVGRVAFVAVDPGSARAGAARFLAIDAFAPQLVVSDVHLARFAVSTPDAPEALDADPRLREFELVGVTPAGIRLYRRRP
jgi:hypothetical protein